MTLEPHRVVAVFSSQFLLVASPHEPALQAVRSPQPDPAQHTILLSTTTAKNQMQSWIPVPDHMELVCGEVILFLQLPIHEATEAIMKVGMTVGPTSENCILVTLGKFFYMPNDITSNIMLYYLGKPRERGIYTVQMFLYLVKYFFL